MTDMTPIFRTRRARLPVLTNRVDTPFEVMVARRGLRLNNRDPVAAKRFETVHLTLRAAVKK